MVFCAAPVILSFFVIAASRPVFTIKRKRVFSEEVRPYAINTEKKWTVVGFDKLISVFAFSEALQKRQALFRVLCFIPKSRPVKTVAPPQRRSAR